MISDSLKKDYGNLESKVHDTQCAATRALPAGSAACGLASPRLASTRSLRYD